VFPVHSTLKHCSQFSHVPLSALRTFQIVTSGITQPFHVPHMVFPITTSFTFWSTTDHISITFLWVWLPHSTIPWPTSRSPHSHICDTKKWHHVECRERERTHTNPCQELICSATDTSYSALSLILSIVYLNRSTLGRCGSVDGKLGRVPAPASPETARD